MSWPGLGFDPSPGDPAGAAALAGQLDGTARRLRDTHDALATITQQRGTWTGEAARAFAGKLEGLPRYLADAQQSLNRAGGVLGEWQRSLTDLQTRARDLEAEAVAARARLAGAQGAEQQARANPDFGLAGRQFAATDLPDAQRRLDAAQAGLDRASSSAAGLQASLEDLLRRGKALAAEHGDAARRTADGVRRADDGLAPPEPGWFDEAIAWVGEHLGDIGDVAGMISAVAATLALIPVLTPFAGPIALISGGVALLAHSADIAVNDKVTDVNAWVSVGGDALGLLPGAVVVKEVAAGVKASIESSAGLGNLAPAVMEGVRQALPELNTAMGGAGLLTAAAADRLAPMLDRLMPTLTRVPGATVDPEILAKGLAGGFTIGTQIPTVVGWAAPSPDVEAAKNGAGWASGAKPVLDAAFDKFVAATS